MVESGWLVWERLNKEVWQKRILVLLGRLKTHCTCLCLCGCGAAKPSQMSVPVWAGDWTLPSRAGCPSTGVWFRRGTAQPTHDVAVEKPHAWFVAISCLIHLNGWNFPIRHEFLALEVKVLAALVNISTSPVNPNPLTAPLYPCISCSFSACLIWVFWGFFNFYLNHSHCSNTAMHSRRSSQLVSVKKLWWNDCAKRDVQSLKRASVNGEQLRFTVYLLEFHFHLDWQRNKRTNPIATTTSQLWDRRPANLKQLMQIHTWYRSVLCIVF